MTAVRPLRLTRRGRRVAAAVRTACQHATRIGLAACMAGVPAVATTWS